MGLTLKYIWMALFYIRQHCCAKVLPPPPKCICINRFSLEETTDPNRSSVNSFYVWQVTLQGRPDDFFLQQQQDGCFTGQSGRGSLKLITSISNDLQQEAGTSALEHLQKETWLVMSRTDVQVHQVSWWWPWLWGSNWTMSFCLYLCGVNLGSDLLNSDNTLSLKMAH